MAPPKKTLETNPELGFVDVDLLDLYRRLTDAGEWSRALRAGCIDFVATVKEGHELNDPSAKARYRRMLRRLLDLETTPPPRKRVASGTVVRSKRRSAMGA